MPSHSVTMPALATFPDAQWLNGTSRLDEDTKTKETTTMTWSGVDLNTAELAILVAVPDSLVQDELFDVLGELKPRIAESFGVAIDNAALWGDLKPTLWSGGAGIGIYDSAVAAGNIVTPATVIEGHAAPGDLGAQFGYAAQLLAEDGFDPNGFAVQAGLKWRLRNARDTVGQPIYNGENGYANAQPATLFGENLYEVKNGAWDRTRAVGLIGDWRWAMVGLRQDMTFSVHRDGVITDAAGLVKYNAVSQDGFILRCVMRIAFATANPVTRLNTNSATRYPFAVVQPSGAPSS
jgi:predicted phage gp36 major capsid-like protein